MALLASLASGQTSDLYGITHRGVLVRVDVNTGEGVPLRKLPDDYRFVDGLVYAGGHFYAAHGTQLGEERSVVQFDFALGTEVNLGPAGVKRIKDFTITPSGTIYLPYSDGAPGPNKIGRLNLGPRSCSVSFVAQPGSPFLGMCAITAESESLLWITNLQHPPKLANMVLPSGTVSAPTPAMDKIGGIAIKGTSPSGGREFYVVTSEVDFGPSTLHVMSDSGALVQTIGPIGHNLSVVEGLTYGPPMSSCCGWLLAGPNMYSVVPGAVGIANPYPQSPLDVRDDKGYGKARTLLTLRTGESVDGTAGQLDWAQGVAAEPSVTGRISNYFAVPSHLGLSFWTYTFGLAERMRLTPHGRLLVGTTADSDAMLDVRGDENTGVSSIAHFENNQSGDTLVRVDNGNRGSLANARFGAFSDAAGAQVIAFSSAYPTFGSMAGFVGDASAFGVVVGANKVGGYIRFDTSGLGHERMRIDADGNVGIGTDQPRFKLEVDGAAAKPGGGLWTSTSDARLKRDIEPIEGALETLLALRGVTFEFIDPQTIHELPGRRTGFVAQDVERTIPDWVDEGPDGYKRLTIRGFEALAVEALRELSRRQDELVAENQALKQRLAAIERRMGIGGSSR